MLIKKSKLLGRMLVDQKIISQEQLEVALHEQKKTDEFLGITLIKLGFASEDEVLPILSQQLEIEYIKIKNLKLKPEILKKVPAKFAYHYKLMPIRSERGILTIAIADPLDIHIIDDVSLLVGLKAEAVLASEKDILEAIRKYYGVGAETIESMIGQGKEKETKEIALVTEDIEDLATDASIGKFVNQILLEAYKDRATDIHIEPYEDELKVRYRIDGILYDAKVPTTIKRFQPAIISRIKIMSNLNIAEKRLPQDGRIKVKVGGEDLDLRVSILPTQHGESVVIRLLGSSILFSLEGLGLSKDNLELLDSLIKKPHGIIFVTGPTGSGKTTTLYTCLSKINNVDKKIITIEDPIEYQLKGVTQIQIHPRIGLTFAQGLRSMLRHDPDIMMVGEVRDFETAEITIRVALTGHLVFSTLHTNDAASGITRLLDMGIEPFLASSSVECFIAQRLVRLVCPDCKIQVESPKNILKDFDVEGANLSESVFYEGKGCEFCKFTGYKGRIGIYEFLIMHDEIRDMVLRKLPANQIKKKALSLGMKTLQLDGLDKVKNGLTTLAEVIRVTQQEESI
ncbi:MAG: Flp pilus assembly complex ATPase component TadA [Candidatus Omnitrophica bacterium]|nr:Flp pilus assembly complex ATPase component TadA [Candidatus Omnitrophota bacterium]